MISILLTVNAVICVALIIIILLQRSDPASGGMFGGAGGGNQAVIRNPLAKPTAILAALFLVFSLVLAYLNKGGGHGESVMAEHAEAPVAAGAVSGTVVLPGPSLLSLVSESAAQFPVSQSAPVSSPTAP